MGGGLLALEVIPACFQLEDEDIDECLDKVDTDDIVKRCQCKSYEQVKEDLFEALEVYCEGDRDSKHHRSAGQIAIWSRFLGCGPRQNPGTFRCQMFFRNEVHLSAANSFFLGTGNTNAFLLNQALGNRGNTNPLTNALIFNQVFNRGNNRTMFLWTHSSSTNSPE